MRVRNATHPLPALDRPYTLTASEVVEGLAVDPLSGLSSEDALHRRLRFGENRLRYRKPKSAWSIAFDQLKSLIIWLLIAAAVLSFALTEWAEGWAIAIVILINGAIGFTTEIRAVRSMESLRRLATVTTRVMRDGRTQEIPAEALVPGDVVLLDAGDVITADLRLAEAANLQCDESTLSGESLPVSKSVDPLPANAPLVERANMAFKGTAATRGTGCGIVVATGTHSELGQIASLAEEAEAAVSPLEKRLDRLSRQLLWVTLAMVLLIAFMGIASGKDPLLMLETSIALAVAAVPEGLPIVATLALARGMLRMAKRNVLIERLSAVETLGATTVIFTDKTGTLTENRMTVTELFLAEGPISVETGRRGTPDPPSHPARDPALVEALRIAALCSNAELDQAPSKGASGLGDPMELALLAAASENGIDRNLLLADYPEVREEAFDPETKSMATYHADGTCFRVAVKGAPEAIIKASTKVWSEDGPTFLDDALTQYWHDANNMLAAKGMRVLAVAEKLVTNVEMPPYQDLILIGLIGMEDPARSDVRQAIQDCQGAGVKVVMVTGDQAATATHIAQSLGLEANGSTQAITGSDLHVLMADKAGREQILSASVFARVSPKQKLDLIDQFQAQGHVVAMTGDGVNDAPALKKADIGVAMGQRGTQVAREAADMVLRDDAFTSIVAAIGQGRVIFGNIRKFVVYLLSCNLSEILVVSVAAVSGLPLPLQPLQILFLNLVTDVFPAFALGAGEGEPGVMKRPPRDPADGILTRRQWTAIAVYGALITFSVMTAFSLAIFWLQSTEREAVTISFLTLALAQLWHVFNMRGRNSTALRNEITANPWIWRALFICIVLITVAVYIPVVAEVLQISPPDLNGWALIGSMSVVPTIVGQIALFLSLSNSSRSQDPHHLIRS
ncbi:MAG: cation-translocating P-type ATPase [Alphaproteobacteria bacterium]